jgi:hypothetical protein
LNQKDYGQIICQLVLRFPKAIKATEKERREREGEREREREGEREREREKYTDTYTMSTCETRRRSSKVDRRAPSGASTSVGTELGTRHDDDVETAL